VSKRCEGLRAQGRHELARLLEAQHQTPLEAYARSLWEPAPRVPEFSPLLRRALEAELHRLGFGLQEAERHLESLERTRVLQTATHLTLSEGPTFLGLHRLALMGRPEGETYWVGAWSGVPFANSAWSGCMNWSNRFPLERLISEKAPRFRDLKQAELDRARDTPEGFSENRFAVVPGKWRDARVYGSTIPERTLKLTPHFAHSLTSLMPKVVLDHSFTSWACRFSRNQLERALRVKDVVYFDLNRVISEVLVHLLEESGHPLRELLCDPERHQQMLDELGEDTVWFFGEVVTPDRRRFDPLRSENGYLSGRGVSVPLVGTSLHEELRTGGLCPGLLLSFSLLAFESGLTCLGSFEQIEYLERFRNAWAALQESKLPGLNQARTNAFCWGRSRDAFGQEVYPLDILLGEPLPEIQSQTLGEWLGPLWGRLGLEAPPSPQNLTMESGYRHS
jgi:hypothetical protein